MQESDDGNFTTIRLVLQTSSKWGGMREIYFLREQLAHFHARMGAGLHFSKHLQDKAVTEFDRGVDFRR